MTKSHMWLWSLVLIGCQGQIGDPGVEIGGPNDVPPRQVPPGELAVGESPLRPLNQREYTNTVADLFDLETLGSLALPQDQRNAAGFDTDGAVVNLPDAAAEQYFVAAETIASQTRERGIEEFDECEGLSGAELHSCLDPGYRPWLARAFRQPPSDSSVARLSGLAATVDAYADALEVITVFTLVSPNFLYHYKSPLDRSDLGHLDAYEIANRLSYLVWSTLPDAELLAAAADGSLLDTDALDAQAQRLLDDPRSDRFIDAFLELWLNIDRLPARAQTDEEVVLFTDMVTESMTFGADVFRNRAVAELVTADFSFMNARLAEHYGMDAAGLDDATFMRVPLPGERQGLLTQASVLTARSPEHVSDPIRRGVWTAREFLCAAPVAGPPPDVGALEVTGEGETVREVLEEHQQNPVCASCHRYTDPYGLAVETFDAFGIYRDTYDNGRVVDPSGELPNGETFGDIYELNELIADNGDLERCVAQHLGTYGLGRMLTLAENEALHESLDRHLGETGASQARLVDIVRSLVRSPLFVQAGGSL